MKKIISIISVISLLLVTGCTNDLEQEMNDGKLSFSSISASMADLPTSRVHLENDGRVVWDVDDQIGIYSDTQTTPEGFTCVDLDYEGQILFTSANEVSGNHFFAYYPFRERVSPFNKIVIDENLITYRLFDDYNEKASDIFYKSPMVAKSNTNEFKFKHACGFVKFSIVGEKEIVRLTLVGNNNEIIAGTGTIDLEQDLPVFSIPNNATDKSQTCIINYWPRIQLSATPTDFYFVVPPMAFSKGLSLKVCYADGEQTKEIVKTTSKSVNISRSVIKSFSTFDLNELIEQELKEEENRKEGIYNALMAFYNATDGTNWINNTNWGNKNKPFSEWYGISTDNCGNPVSLVLYKNGLKGTIPAEIGNLKELKNLNLSFNMLSGAIPNSICNLEKLESLILTNNGLTGELPENIGNMVALEQIDISNATSSAAGGDVNVNDTLSYYNQISGEIPLSLTTLPNLVSFYADDNKLSGNIPDGIWSMPSLKYLGLRGNRLTGSISSAIANAKGLEQLWLGNNHLTGPIPDDICEMTNLKELSLGNGNLSMAIGRYPAYQYNVFSGSIPNNINKLTNLERLSLNTCGLSGTIPNSLYTMSKLKEFNVGNSAGGGEPELTDQIETYFNHISGVISSDVVGLINLERFGIAGNEITGNIPKEIGSLLSLKGLDFANNKLGGTIPAELGNLQNLEYLKLFDNNIEGNIPKELANLSQLSSLMLMRNKMSGYIPEEITSSPMWSSSVWNPDVWILPQQEGYGFSPYYESIDMTQDGVVNTLQTASIGNGIDVVLMGDGYTDRLIADGTYDRVMNIAMEKFFSEEPYKSYQNMFNVYSVKAVSQNEVYANGTQTKFSGYFGERTEVGGNDSIVFSYAQKAISAERMNEALIVVMMNSSKYAGTCYMYHSSTQTGDYGNGPSISYFPIGTDETELAQILLHEAGGHGFAKLGDEYAFEEYGTVPTDYVTQIKEQQTSWGWWKNVDFTDVPTNVRWNYFLSDDRYANDGLGVYEGGLTYWTGVWRPTENSIMRYNTGGFNAPSREAIYYRIHKLGYGDSWQYNYEDFVKYDAKNRIPTATRSVTNFKQMLPLHEPIVIKGSWKEAKNNKTKER